MKSILSKTLIASLVLGTSLSAAADSTLKVAVVKDVTGSSDIISGQYERSIKKLNRSGKYSLAFEKSMNLCVAHLQAKNIDESQAACTAAVKSSASMDMDNEKSVYLKSLSYSNLAIAKYFNDDIEGAIADLTTAANIDENEITLENLENIKAEYDTVYTATMTAD